MKYEFKEGDKLKVIDGEDSLPIGSIVTCDKNYKGDNDREMIDVISLNRKNSGWYVYRFEKIFEQDIKNLPKPKAPTHLVVWDVQSRDPSKFFTSEKDAQEYIKTLSSDTNVSNIKIVEIKLVKEVKISKRLAYSTYKI